MLLLLAASAWLYGALLVLYPEAFRRRYSEEMRRDFSELLREGLEEGGAKELVKVLAQAHSDLVLTALKERATTAARRYASYYLSVDPRIAVRAAARAMVAVVLIAVGVTGAGLWQTPTYEAYAHVWVDQQLGNQGKNLAGNVEGLQSLMPTMIHAIDSRPVADEALRNEAIRSLGLEMSPEELLNNLTIEQVEGTNFISLTYEGTSAAEATQIVNTMAEVSSKRISDTTKAAGSNLTATPYVKATVPDNPTPVSPDPLRNGLLAAVFGLMLGIGLALLMEYLDHSWRSPEEVEQASGVPTFATIPDFSLAKSKRNKRTLA
jgi:capsular polysaccharide biosynthesis protein